MESFTKKEKNNIILLCTEDVKVHAIILVLLRQLKLSNYALFYY